MIECQRVLIIDEHGPSRFVLDYELRRRGYACSSAETADAALASIDSFKPCIVILEWALKNGTGIGLAAKLRARSAELDRRLVIVITSFADEPADFRSREDVDDYMIKPVTVAAIETAIRRSCPREPSG